MRRMARWTAAALMACGVAHSGAGVPVAVMPLVASGEFSKDRALIGDILQSELSMSGALTLVDRENLDRALREMHLGASDMADAQSAARVGRIVGAKYFCGGSLRPAGGGVVAMVRITDVETTVTKLAYARVMEESDVVQVAQALAADVIKLVQAFETEKGAAAAEAATARREIPAAWKRPTVMVVVHEGHIAQPQPPDPAAETEIAKRLLEVGFKVIDSEYAKVAVSARDARNATRWFTSLDTTADYAAKKGAAVLLYGEALSERAGQLDAFRSCRARVELKAVDTKTGAVLLSDSAYGGAVDTAEIVAGKKAIQKAAATLCEEFLYRLAETWNAKSAP